MRCLSVSQPYADLIVSGKKTIELRAWNTKFRGEFLVHAPLKVDANACRVLGINAANLRKGAIIGKAEIWGVKKYRTIKELREDQDGHLAGKGYLDHRYGFLLRNPKSLEVPIPYKGALGFFEVKLKSKMRFRNNEATNRHP
ncbi:MAG: ASCH domain-containing protein [Candidatus Micrarchaeota archaeon]|nr:ASCH domain-containing protein [Candidatus Micrarchaeota archaeon]MDE1846517.1 ASCH domain-containing protein [Candidatus Micrarchaeota archaeon]